MATKSQARPEVEELNREQEAALLDAAARRELNMSGAEFQAAWEQGRFVDDERPQVTTVAMLLPDSAW